MGKSFDILNTASQFICKRFSMFGINKKREIARLVYEIAKRDNIEASGILDNIKINSFGAVKDFLLRKRYPVSYPDCKPSQFYLPEININKRFALKIVSQRQLQKIHKFYPKKVFIERSVGKSYLAEKFKHHFPKAEFLEISSLKDYLKEHRNIDISDYNKRQDNVFIVKEKFDFFKICPCTKGAVGCGYNIFNLGFGCIFECTYCYLQEYVNTQGIVLTANTEDFFDKFNKYKRAGMRIGTGEFADSLMLDNITGYSSGIISFFKNQKDVLFEFKTKSNNIENLLNTKHSGNIVVSWSLNPKKIINENEFYSASLEERINSAEKCSSAGYKIGFHFDPIFYYYGWERDYKELISFLFSKISTKNIVWISIGTFRFKPELKKIIENRFPENTILNEELILGYDNKMRYPYKIRQRIYKFLTDEMKKYDRNLPIYLCMEEKSMWSGLNLPTPF